MANGTKSGAPKARRTQPALSLLVRPADRGTENVDAEQFFSVAERWLRSLQVFARESGQHAAWEIVALEKSSAFVQVRPVDVHSRRPLPTLVRKWDAGLREVKRTGHPPEGFTTGALKALDEFVHCVPCDAVVSVGNAAKKRPLAITAEIQRRVEQAVAEAVSAVPREYSVRGALRGRLAVLDSWNPEERSFRLQLPLAQSKAVRCTYRDETLVTALGSGFEGMIEIDGLLHYRRDEVWPHRAEVGGIRVLSRQQAASLRDLVGLLHLPDGQDSVAYVRGLRDAE